MTNTAPSVHRYTVDIAVPTDINPDDALARALATMSDDMLNEAMIPNRVTVLRFRDEPDSDGILDLDNAPDAPE